MPGDLLCQRCGGIGFIPASGRFCCDPSSGAFCAAANALRSRIETAPEFAEFRRKRAEIDRAIRNLEAGDHWRAQGYPAGEILHPDETNLEVN